MYSLLLLEAFTAILDARRAANAASRRARRPGLSVEEMNEINKRRLLAVAPDPLRRGAVNKAQRI